MHLCRGFGFLSILLAAALARGAELSGRLRAQVGEEYDTNVHRVNGTGVQSSDQDRVIEDGLTRLVFQWTLRVAEEDHQFLFDYLGGVKLFHHQTSEDLVATQIEAAYTFHLSPRWWLGSRWTLNDTKQSVHTRDYSLPCGEIFQRLSLLRSLSLEFFEGVRILRFKHDDTLAADQLKYSHWGPLLGTRLSWYFGRADSLSLFYQADWRFFFSRYGFQLEAGVPIGRDFDRLDVRHQMGLRLRLEFAYWKDLKMILEGTPEFTYNRSNSYGSTMYWLRLRLLAAVQLPLDFTVQLMGTLQASYYPDGISFEGQLYEPEADENENSLAARLSYRLWDGFSLVLQGALYRNDFHSSSGLAPFQRETLTLAVAYELPL